MITKLYDEDPRLDRDIAIAIKNRVLKEAMSEWASQTKLDKDVEIAVKNRALKEMMLSWSGKSTIHLQGEDPIGGIEPTGDIEGEGAIAACAAATAIPAAAFAGTSTSSSDQTPPPLYRKYIWRAAAVIIMILSVVPFMPDKSEGIDNYVSQCTYYSNNSVVRSKSAKDSDLLTQIESDLSLGNYKSAAQKACVVQDDLRSIPKENWDFTIKRMMDDAQWYEALARLQMGKVKDKVRAKIILRRICADEKHTHYQDADNLYKSLL